MGKTNIKSLPDGARADDLRRAWEAFVAQSSEAMLVTDAKGIVEFVNPAFVKISGHAMADAVGKHLKTLHGQVEDKEPHLQMWRALEKDGSWKGQITSKRADGRLYTEECVISPLHDGAGKIAHYIVTKRDMTHEHQLEQLFRHSQKMEAVGSLMGGIAHDFNNLVGAILGHSDLLLEQLSDAPALAKRVEAIRDAAQKTAQITRQLLAFSQRQQSEPRVMDLNVHLQEMMDMIQRLAGENIEVDVSIGDGDMQIKMDPGYLDQVIVNLVVNARDTMPDGGKLNLETASVELAGGMDPDQPELAPGVYVMLSVRDNGTGVPENVGQRMGLGLAAAHGIIRQCGGQLVLRRQEGAGSACVVYMPCAADAVAAAPAAREVKAPPKAATQSILLVEDEKALREMTKEMLARAGYRVVCAADGEDALKFCEKEVAHFDLLFTDMVMPKMSGIALAERLKKSMPKMKLLVMSGYAQDAKFHQKLLSQGVNFIAKPYTMEHLTRRVREVLRMP